MQWALRHHSQGPAGQQLAQTLLSPRVIESLCQKRTRIDACRQPNFIISKQATDLEGKIDRVIRYWQQPLDSIEALCACERHDDWDTVCDCLHDLAFYAASETQRCHYYTGGGIALFKH
ncbi:hypothetical protein EDF77_2967 [Stenotrophomonas maltophilia]|nr:hypothetical protein EDF77_2967 [Stenotrophomonas maltophilia]